MSCLPPALPSLGKRAKAWPPRPSPWYKASELGKQGMQARRRKHEAKTHKQTQQQDKARKADKTRHDKQGRHTNKGRQRILGKAWLSPKVGQGKARLG